MQIHLRIFLQENKVGLATITKLSLIIHHLNSSCYDLPMIGLITLLIASKIWFSYKLFSKSSESIGFVILITKLSFI